MTLTPSRGLDAKVAEAVGCKPHEFRIGTFVDYDCLCPDLDHAEGDGSVTLKAYSNSTSAAMAEPWEWLKIRDPQTTLTLSKQGNSFFCYRAVGSQEGCDMGPYPTEALAICAAVLAAAGTFPSEEEER